MKKLALSSLVAMLAVSSANAATNYFVGGNAGVSLNDDHATVLAVSPEFGWKLNSDWDLGFAAHFGYDHAYLPATYGVKGEAYNYGADLFARYNVAQFGGVKLLLKGEAGVDLWTGSPEHGDAETLTSIGASIIPMITYDLTESFTLYANLNFLAVRAAYDFENKDLGRDSGWRLGALVDSNDVANTGNFQIGFNYNF